MIFSPRSGLNNPNYKCESNHRDPEMSYEYKSCEGFFWLIAVKLFNLDNNYPPLTTEA